jgi:hypothetical protein
MGRPTDDAINYFANAKLRSRDARSLRIGGKSNEAEKEDALAFEEMLSGLQSLARGLRATYILLEEVKGMLQRAR